jgi:hydrogenase maturation protease
MMEPRILIAGIGNIFFGDDAFGVEVVRRLAQRGMPAGVRVVDFGIRGLDLAYTLSEGWDAAILVDAVRRGGKPGTVYLIEPEIEANDELPAVEPHALDPRRMLTLARTLGGDLGRVLLVGCEPAAMESEDGTMELSESVKAAVPEAIRLLDSLLDEIRSAQLC